MKKHPLLTILALTLACVMLFAACSKPKTLEEYFATPEAAKELEQMIDGMDNEYFTFEVYAEGNTLVYGAKATTQMDPEAEDTIQMVDSLKNAYTSFGSTFESIADALNEELGVTDVVVELRFTNADGSELFTMSFK